jgi:hypothetical protein
VHSVTIPSNTLIFQKAGLQVGVVRDGKAELVPITIGRDYGSTLEVVTGLQPTDQVIANPSDSLIAGTPVRIKAQPNNQSKPQPNNQPKPQPAGGSAQ